MREKPNKAIYYSVLYANIFICATALIYAYFIVIDSYKKANNKDYTSFIDTRNYTQDSAVSNAFPAMNSEKILVEDAKVINWATRLIENLIDPAYLELDLNKDIASASFTKSGWQEFEAFLESISNDKASYKLHEIKKTTSISKWDDNLEARVWTLMIPLSTSEKTKENNTYFSIDVIEQSDDHGALKINRWDIK